MSALNRDPERIRRDLRDRDGDDCQLCGEPICWTIPPGSQRGASIDHRKPRAAGGTDAFANLQLAHWICNQAKGAQWQGTEFHCPMPLKEFESFSAARSA